MTKKKVVRTTRPIVRQPRPFSEEIALTSRIRRGASKVGERTVKELLSGESARKLFGERFQEKEFFVIEPESRNPHFDFLWQVGKRKFKVEVKTVTMRGQHFDSLQLKILDGHMVNQQADIFFVITPKSLYSADANRLRAFVSNAMKKLDHLRERSFERVVSVPFSLGELIRSNVLVPENVEPHTFRRLLETSSDYETGLFEVHQGKK